MNKEIIEKILNSEKLKDIPLLDVITVLTVVMECKYDYKNRSKKRRSSDTDEVLIII